METTEEKIASLKARITEIEAEQKTKETASKPDIAAAIRRHAAEQNAKNLKK
jgi:hypothetical protein